MNSHCGICDVEKQCGYQYKPCDCRDYLKFVPKKPEVPKPAASFVDNVRYFLKQGGGND